jgi:polyhydroxybutyrate depolymerase
VDPRNHERGGVLGGLFAVTVALTACANAHAAPPRPDRAAATSTSSTPDCGQPLPAGTTSVTLHLDGHDRRARVHVPRRYRPDRSFPLVLNLHGSGSTGDRQAVNSGMDVTADAHDFLVAYPEGERRLGSGYIWNIPGTPNWQAHGPDEATVLGRLVGLLHQRYCVDLDRVYAVGFSGGARLVSQLACGPDPTIVAVAMVGGLRAPSPCGAGPVAVLAVHGTADAQNPYDGHGQPYWTYGVPEAARRWAVHDGCSLAPTVNRISPGVTVTGYRGCRADSAVQLYTLTGRGHVWPSVRNGGFDCDEVVWQFFAAHPRRPADHGRPRG